MTAPLAKILHSAPKAASHAPDSESGAPGPRKANKPLRRWLLTALMTPALVLVLSLVGTGVASASTVTGNGPTIAVGVLVEATNWDATVACDAGSHTMNINATAFPAITGESVFEQVWLYSYQTRTGNWGPANQTETMNGQAQYPPGYYYVYINFGWYTSAGWQTTKPVPISSYTQYGTTWYRIDNSASCRL
jgi:hypothetical protein